MAFALHVKTESGDDYMFTFDGTPTVEEVIEIVRERMDEEFEYISTYHYDSTYSIDFKMKTK